MFQFSDRLRESFMQAELQAAVMRVDQLEAELDELARQDMTGDQPPREPPKPPPRHRSQSSVSIYFVSIKKINLILFMDWRNF